MDPSNAVNMPTPTEGWKWIYPVGTIVGEVLMKKFADSSWATYEVRLRLRELDDWEFEREVPFQNLAELQAVAGTVQATEMTLRYHDDLHPTPAFDFTGTVTELGPIQNARQLLSAATFRPGFGATGFTAQDHENIVPAKFLGGMLGYESCVECHKHCQMHVDRFANRDWYGNQAGSADGIRTFHPFEPSSIGPPNKPVVLRKSLVEAGMVEMFDTTKHPSDVYAMAPKYDTRPGGDRKTSNRRIVGGE
jgi:hypothetical protein